MRVPVVLLCAALSAVLTWTGTSGFAAPQTSTSADAAASAQSGDESYTVHYVPTVGDAVIRVEVWRDTSYDAAGQPAILTYSPYNSISEPEPARDYVGERYVPRGYARVVADVLGTRGSTGCWDYGGPKEQQSGVDVVRWLAERGWSNGKVAMIGGSYNGTTASMVAARGLPALRGIVPIAGISRWYGYAYGNGIRYFLNSDVPTDEGFDTPLAFDFGFAKTVAADPMGQHFADTLRDRAAECDAITHTEKGYSRNPDYDKFWVARDYRRRADRFRAAVLLAHGWQDYNVKQEEGTELFRSIPIDDPATASVEGVPFKLMYLAQGSHSGATKGEQWQGLLDRFFAHTLKGVRNGIATEGPVITQGRTFDGPTSFRVARDYPLPATDRTRLWLRGDADPMAVPGLTADGALARTPDRAGRRHVASYVETGTSTEELGVGARLSYISRPLARDARMVGSARLVAHVRMENPVMHLTPVLLDVAPDGSSQTLARGFLHVDYRNGLEENRPAPGTWVRATVRMLPQDYTLLSGHRLALSVQSSNTVWAVPGNPGRVDLADGRLAGVTAVGSRLTLPTIGDQIRFR